MKSYKANQNLPSEVGSLVCESAQDLYCAAYDCVFQWYGDKSKAHNIAAGVVESMSNLHAIARRGLKIENS